MSHTHDWVTEVPAVKEVSAEVTEVEVAMEVREVMGR